MLVRQNTIIVFVFLCVFFFPPMTTHAQLEGINFMHAIFFSSFQCNCIVIV